jgi:eukaryotic-like serine/threonine-protein kinase
MTQLSDKIVARLQSGMQAPDLAGTRYSNANFLARGGMGSVWLVDDSVLDRRVALKVLDLASPSDDLAARLLQEARILARLEHPGIVPVHDAGTLADGRVFYCMKYVEGQTLAQHASSLSLPDRLRLLQRIAEPVGFAHSRGVIHRDLKPENVMIGSFGEVLVMDWGLAKVASESASMTDPGKMLEGTLRNTPRATGSGGVLGTQGYMSPEQLRGIADIDHRTDIFSLGAVLSFLLDAPNPAAPVRVPARALRPLYAICKKAMSPEPADRYQSVAELSDDLARYLGGSPVTAYSESILERLQRVCSRHSTAIILVAAYLLMRLLFILFSRR